MNEQINIITNSLSDNEALILNKISSNGAASQREISKRSGLSVGLINVLIKNLVTKGYVKLTKLNKKNVSYLLTSKGLTEQLKLTSFYIHETFNRINNYKKWLCELIEEKINNGKSQFIILGKNELADILNLVLKDYNNISYVKLSVMESITSTNMIILDCNEVLSSEIICANNEQYINIISYISIKMNG
ncbi:MAG: winged helix-turn-helix transcriptional regulator [Spirochaetota bacterium]|nr:winged helix-turn-helix transcriptional regulator [Spirochaetota bacterium]